MEKGSSQKSPFSRDSREFRDSRDKVVSDRGSGTVAGAASVRGRGAATNLRLKTQEKQALNGPPLVTFEYVPAMEVKKLLRHVPRPPTLTYVLLTYGLEIPDKGRTATQCSKKGSEKVW